MIDYEHNIIRVKIHSRHLSQTVYNTFIQYGINCAEPIEAWYCDCRSGARTVGCCAYVTSILWFLGVARHNPIILKNRKSIFFQKLLFECRKYLNTYVFIIKK